MASRRKSNGQIPFGTVSIVQPLATLTIYPYALMMKRMDAHGTLQEYPVDPSALAGAIAATVKFETGLLGGNTVYVSQHGSTRVVVEYRPPEVIGLFLDGSEKVLRVPLPGMVMKRSVTGLTVNYQIYAVKQRPQRDDEPMFMAPLPNVSHNGTCWGTVTRPADVSGVSLAEDWRVFLGSPFGNHSVEGKSKKFPKDIRQMLLKLDGQKRKSPYPESDLREMKLKLSDLFKGKD